LLWYGYIYYILFNTILISSVVFLLRLYFLNSINQLSIIATSSRLFLSSLLFLFFITFTSLHYLLDYYQDILMFSSTDSCISVLSTYYNSKIIDVNAVSLNLIQVYYYPFIYVFLIVTVLSVVFCLSYNTDELFSFMFYCLVILAAGYVIFFTDSIILFFLAYEMLLIPSFFILYKFAKTRRCVEAAYLMFFWTQFGALFLIFGLLYLFFICGSSQFSTISYFYFSPFEVNFLFVCVLLGFGVKLPI
jgi:formate hydrogenlyase subunit 3/multisubunit Na+/H+ antiporter MnhD subunit